MLISPDDPDGHRMIGFVPTATRAVMPLGFQVDGCVRMISVSVTVTDAGLSWFGLGLVQVPHYRVARELAAGELVEVLADYLPTDGWSACSIRRGGRSRRACASSSTGPAPRLRPSSRRAETASRARTNRPDHPLQAGVAASSATEPGVVAAGCRRPLLEGARP